MDLAEPEQHHLPLPHGNVPPPAEHQHRVQHPPLPGQNLLFAALTRHQSDESDGVQGPPLGRHRRRHRPEHRSAPPGGRAHHQRQGQRLAPRPLRTHHFLPDAADGAQDAANARNSIASRSPDSAQSPGSPGSCAQQHHPRREREREQRSPSCRFSRSIGQQVESQQLQHCTQVSYSSQRFGQRPAAIDDEEEQRRFAVVGQEGVADATPQRPARSVAHRVRHFRSLRRSDERQGLRRLRRQRAGGGLRADVRDAAPQRSRPGGHSGQSEHAGPTAADEGGPSAIARPVQLVGRFAIVALHDVFGLGGQCQSHDDDQRHPTGQRHAEATATIDGFGQIGPGRSQNGLYSLGRSRLSLSQEFAP